MPSNNRNKWIGGISITTIIAVALFYFTVIDRAQSSGVEKATLKGSVEAISDRVTALESGMERTNHHLHEGVKELKEQNRLILQEIRKLQQ